MPNNLLALNELPEAQWIPLKEPQCSFCSASNTSNNYHANQSTTSSSQRYMTYTDTTLSHHATVFMNHPQP